MEIVEIVEMVVIRNRWILTNPVKIVEIVEMVVMVEAIRNGWQPISPVEIVEMVEVICNRCQPISQVEIVEIGDIVEMTGAATQPLAAQHQSGNSENSGNGGDDTQSLLAYHTSGNCGSDDGDTTSLPSHDFRKIFENHENGGMVEVILDRWQPITPVEIAEIAAMEDVTFGGWHPHSPVEIMEIVGMGEKICL